MMTERAARFLSAYNKIDQTLRNVYRYKPAMSFVDIVRRTAPLNFIVSRYEDDLLDYGRLRNAIVHKNVEGSAIAEPYEETVEQLEHICTLITTPPLAVDVFGAKVRCLPPDTSIRDAVLALTKTGFSNMPVFDGKKIFGVVGNKTLLAQIARLLEEEADLCSELGSRPVHPVLDAAYYMVMSKQATLPKLCDEFYRNRKLLAVVITERGSLAEEPLAIVTNSDVSKMENILTDYD